MIIPMDITLYRMSAKMKKNRLGGWDDNEWGMDDNREIILGSMFNLHEAFVNYLDTVYDLSEGLSHHKIDNRTTIQLISTIDQWFAGYKRKVQLCTINYMAHDKPLEHIRIKFKLCMQRLAVRIDHLKHNYALNFPSYGAENFHLNSTKHHSPKPSNPAPPWLFTKNQQSLKSAVKKKSPCFHERGFIRIGSRTKLILMHDCQRRGAKH